MISLSVLQFCKDSPKAQKYLIGGLEMLIGQEYSTSLMPRVPHILKAFYDLDILDEEVILEWAKKASSTCYRVVDQRGNVLMFCLSVCMQVSE